MSWPHATRNLKNADAGDLARMRDAAAALIEHERRISPDALTVLLQIREEATAALRTRSRAVPATAQAS
jgi:hypothetical protein